MLAAVVAAKKRREKQTHQKQKLPPNQGSEHEPPPSKRPRRMMAPSIPASAQDIADSPLPSLETLVSPRFPPDPPLTRSEYFSWDHVDVQYAAETSQSKIQVMKDKQSRHALRKLAQADRWNREALPSLIRPYMKVAWGHFSDLWQKSPIVLQYVDVGHLDPFGLSSSGFFPCAPLFPTLAVSLDMLEFVASLFLHTAPNERAWASDSGRVPQSSWVLVRLVRAEITRIVQDDKRGLISELDERTAVNAPATILTRVSADLPPDVCSNFIPATIPAPVNT
ncbi:hypothetical protein BS47DRAFT_1395890 [Hydnum rufescens UP504]|uniref:Uncharacterized protein n=1 Tax=Hydnum rufescens UP504 TaxID=1448309 RepID=A0A9P6DTI1_9AGAM|nr:hypothetical protein BS47DRAFT_1395890 [Hydnum rufescens UP504]